MGRWEDGKMDMQSILPLLERKLRIATEEFNRPDLRIFAPPPVSRPSPGMGPRLHGELRHGELRKERMEGNGKGEAQTMNSQALSMKDLDARAA